MTFRADMSDWPEGPYIIQKSDGYFLIMAKMDGLAYQKIAVLEAGRPEQAMLNMRSGQTQMLEGSVLDETQGRKVAALFRSSWEAQVAIQMAIKELASDPKYKALVAHLRGVHIKAKGLA